MFDSFTGNLVFKQKNKIYLENKSGLREIYVNDENLYTMNKEYHLYIYCSKLVSQKSIEKITNFGFETISEMCFFEQLINIEGIGPKTAIKFIVSGIDKFNKLINEKKLRDLVDNYKINVKIAQALINKLNKINLNDLEVNKLNTAINNLCQIGYSRELSTKVIMNRQDEVINNTFSKIFHLLIEDIKNERANS